MSIDGLSDKFGDSGRAIQPVAPVPHTGPANEYPPSGRQQKPAEKRPAPDETKTGEQPEVTPDPGAVIYTPKGEVVKIIPDPPALDVTG